MPFIGVRISWLMLARNSLFALLDSSANALFSRKSSVKACMAACSRSWLRFRNKSATAEISNKTDKALLSPMTISLWRSIVLDWFSTRYVSSAFAVTLRDRTAGPMVLSEFSSAFISFRCGLGPAQRASAGITTDFIWAMTNLNSGCSSSVEILGLSNNKVRRLIMMS